MIVLLTKTNQIVKAKEALDLDRTEQYDLTSILEECQELKNVWTALNQIWSSLNEMSETSWNSVSPRKVRQHLESLLNQAKEMPNRMRQYAAFEYLQTTLKEYLRVNSLLTELKSEALKERHWKTILSQVRTNDSQNESVPIILVSEITLGHVWGFDLKKNESTLKNIITSAQGEMALEIFLQQVKEIWQNYTLELISYQNKCRLIKGWDELLSKCSEHMGSLSAMKMSPYYKIFSEEGTFWEDKLNQIHLIFDILD